MCSQSIYGVIAGVAGTLYALAAIVATVIVICGIGAAKAALGCRRDKPPLDGYPTTH